MWIELADVPKSVVIADIINTIRNPNLLRLAFFLAVMGLRVKPAMTAGAGMGLVG